MGTKNAIAFSKRRAGNWTPACEILTWIKAMLCRHAEFQIGWKAVIPASDARCCFTYLLVQGVLL